MESTLEGENNEVRKSNKGYCKSPGDKRWGEMSAVGLYFRISTTGFVAWLYVQGKGEGQIQGSLGFWYDHMFGHQCP